ncbi:MAG TPA: TfoX/Sxy family protein [Cyclobacteriaceae bacterium]
MAINEKLTDRVRDAISHVPKVTEKKMFRGITFMVNGKMCISVGNEELMCRVDPALHEALIEKEGVRALKMKGRDYVGFIYIHEDELKVKKKLDYWVALALEFNKKAKASKKKK